MEKSVKKELIKNVKLFIKFYIYSAIAGGIILKGIDLYAYKDNIYYHNELKLSEEELEKLEESVSKKVGEEISEEDNSIILGAVIENKNLNEEEKETIYKFNDLLNDNPYLDKSMAYGNLEKLDIIYDKDADYGENVLGVYIEGDNEITIIEDNEQKDTMLHEIVHCIYANNYYHKLPRFFNEGMTELLTNEYFAENPFKEEVSYQYEIEMVKILCELVGEDKVLEAFSKEDIKIVENELAKSVGLSEPHELIKSMINASDALDKKETINEEDINNIVSVLDKYYEGYDIDSLEYKMYLYNKNIIEGLKESNPYVTYQYNLMLNGYYVKPYFSSKLKEKYPTPHHLDYYIELSKNNDNKIFIKTMKNKEKEDI